MMQNWPVCRVVILLFCNGDEKVKLLHMLLKFCILVVETSPREQL